MKNRTRFFKYRVVVVVCFVGLYSAVVSKFASDGQRPLTSEGDDIIRRTTSASRHLLAHKTRKLNCTPPAILEFPDDFFTQTQRQHGGVIFNFVVSFYMFWAIAIVCDDYFVPCLEIICDKMGLQTDVAGATFMALGSSAPELFASVIGVFITKGDIGVGTILGSAVFNVLFVIGACGLFAGTVLYLAWWPIVRDSLFYLLSLIALMLVLMDNVVVWSEATAMVSFYSVYLLIMYYNPKIEAILYNITNTTTPEYKSDLHEQRMKKRKEIEGDLPLEKLGNETKEITDQENAGQQENNDHLSKEREHEKLIPQENAELSIGSPFSPPSGICPRIWWILGLPLNIAFYFTIPNVSNEKYAKWVVIAFVSCIIWIAVTSYLLVWMVTVIGYTFLIPDSVMGLSLIAFGSSVPDCLSSLFVARKGDGDMAVSHTVGSNVFDILLCLGIPWLIKTTMWEYDSTVVINSHGLFISCFFIVGSIFVALITIYYNKWTLNKKVGIVYMVFYFIFLIISVVVEMNAFGDFNPPMCDIDV